MTPPDSPIENLRTLIVDELVEAGHPRPIEVAGRIIDAFVTGGQGWTLEYEDVPDGPVHRILGPDGMLVADTVTAASAELDIGVPSVAGVILTFGQGRPVGPPQQVSEVLFIGPAGILRDTGRLINDTCNGAANIAQRPRGQRRKNGEKP